MFLSDKINFQFNLDMELVVPIGGPIDISNFTNIWKEWNQNPNKINLNPNTGVWGDGKGDWHGPPEPGYDRVTNLINQSPYSGWYNPEHANLSDYDCGLSVVCESLWDNDVYGIAFRWDPTIMSGYTFEWDASGSDVKGMAIYKLTCKNPSAIGTTEVLEFQKEMLAHKQIYWDPNKPDNSTIPDRVFIPHTIKVSAIGSHLKVWTDGELRLEAYDDTYKKGAWGPITRSNPLTYFWDFWMQSYERITPKEEPNFRQPHSIIKDRPMSVGEEHLIEIELDGKTLVNKFDPIIESYCSKMGLSREDIFVLEWFIRDDKSDYEVYFKAPDSSERLIETRDEKSKVFSTVEGQYPPIGEPEQKDLPTPTKPAIPDLVPPRLLNPNDGFAISWTGYLYAPETGMYRFRVDVDDGFRLWINDNEVLNKWSPTSQNSEGTIYLEGSRWHSIRADYFEDKEEAFIHLFWAPPDDNMKPIPSEYLSPHLSYKIFAKVKDATPLPWHPLIHNGYYYVKDQEYYLYANKATHKVTPNEFHEIWISPRPQQGSPIIVRDNEGNLLRKVAFYDDDWNLTLENKEIFHGNGYAKYYLRYRGIDKETVKVFINNTPLNNYDFFFYEEDSSIEFMHEIAPSDKIEVRYKLLYSYYIDMNPMSEDTIVTEDVAKIVLHSNYDPSKMKNMEIIYESAEDTPFYRAKEVIGNPILNHNHTGFLYITENEKQHLKDMLIHLSPNTISNSGYEKVLLTIKAIDEYNNPIPHKKIVIKRDGKIIGEDFITNHAGEVYLYDEPDPQERDKIIYEIQSEDIVKETILYFYSAEQS